jgi:hypothetical protein
MSVESSPFEINIVHVQIGKQLDDAVPGVNYLLDKCVGHGSLRYVEMTLKLGFLRVST